MGRPHPTYKPVRVDATVREVVEAAAGEVEALRSECEYAAGNFRELDDPRAIGFARAAEALALVDLDASGIPRELGDLPVSFQVLRPRRVSHTYARWARTENTATGLRAVLSDRPEAAAEPWLVSMLEHAATQLDDVKYPKMWG